MTSTLRSESIAQSDLILYTKDGIDRGINIFEDVNHRWVVSGMGRKVEGDEDGLLIQYDKNLIIVWDKCYGGKGFDFLWGVAIA